CALMMVRRRPSAGWAAGCIVVVDLEAFRESFVRENVQTYVCFSMLGWLGLALLVAAGSGEALADSALRWRVAPRGASRAAIGAVRLTASVLIAPLGLGVLRLGPGLGMSIERPAPWRGELAALHFVASAGGARPVRQQQNASGLRSRPGLSELAARTRGHAAFSWPIDGNAIVAAGGIERFAPVPQEYSAHTPTLDAIDAGYFAGASGPRLGLGAPVAIDQELPLQTAPRTFLALLACYRPRRESGSLVLITAAGHPRHGCGAEPQRRERFQPWHSGRLGRWTRAPWQPHTITLAEARVHPSLLGASWRALFRTDSIYLRLRGRQGQIANTRVVAATVPDGILVSAVPQTASGLARVWSGTSAQTVAAIDLGTWAPLDGAAEHSIRLEAVPPPPSRGI
ncbi:MAG TPA: hypothetical protein VMW47_07135, partial [Verrucomicrobiae bacterium]|nr:hypothetical protein [Verrucomicrobiae bacterium]